MGGEVAKGTAPPETAVARASFMISAARSVDCVQLAAAVGPASLLAGVNGYAGHAAASCEHHSGSRLWQLPTLF